MTAAVLLIIGLSVDGSGYLHARQRADDVAAQAARAAGERVSAGALRGQSDLTIDGGQAIQAANTYLGTAGMSGSATMGAGGLVTVTATTSYQPVFLGLVGVGPLGVSATEKAQPERA